MPRKESVICIDESVNNLLVEEKGLIDATYVHF